ncbi:heavy metal-responsive transcriptional regulator [Microcoleus sp. FACHB-1515]|uniref:heavy metal-responsive transcriptional regulator n=1 Tax=Cyanophyceae TaxID=3028117 RepID=UPI00168267EA|nr:heavy metal-responsive transcriptional regulator [Microcoleus sp. FACHB-1515]MBD2093390.1 heavy metal-responsive transcriptional regulator [Microcoleus sp. FACHB-1515]
MLAQDAPKLIGSVAKESGLPIKTVRYYEELGLLNILGRTEGGFRIFDSDVLVRLSFIKRAQRLGLSLLEIKELLEVHDRGSSPCEDVKVKLTERLSEVDHQIQQLLLLKGELEGLLAMQETEPESFKETICPIIDHY